jgi:hypothetical protein
MRGWRLRQFPSVRQITGSSSIHLTPRAPSSNGSIASHASKSLAGLARNFTSRFDRHRTRNSENSSLFSADITSARVSSHSSRPLKMLLGFVATTKPIGTSKILDPTSPRFETKSMRPRADAYAATDEAGVVNISLENHPVVRVSGLSARDRQAVVESVNVHGRLGVSTSEDSMY